MTRSLKDVFRSIEKEERCAFIPCLMGGYPDMTTCGNLMKTLDETGADILEIIVPFSDPLADGPTIQKAGQEALARGATIQGILEMIDKTADDLQSSVVIMTYYNPVLAFGVEAFAREAKKAGVSGVLIPDLPPEESDLWISAAREQDLDTIFLAAPTTTSDRLSIILKVCTGFLYYVSMTGVTGSKINLSQEMKHHLALIRERSPIPVAVGFGVSSPQEAGVLAGICDGIIVGSALIKLIQDNEDTHEMIQKVRDFTLDIQVSLNQSRYPVPGPR